MMRDKKGQEMSISTLVLIVIGVIVLVLLVMGFSYGWQNLLDKINIFGGGTTIDNVVTSCNIAASSGAANSFCADFKKVKTSAGIEYINCQDSRVSGSLNTQISCATQVPAMKTGCAALKPTASNKVKINGIEFASTEDCTSKISAEGIK